EKIIPIRSSCSSVLFFPPPHSCPTLPQLFTCHNPSPLTPSSTHPLPGARLRFQPDAPATSHAFPAGARPTLATKQGCFQAVPQAPTLVPLSSTSLSSPYYGTMGNKKALPIIHHIGMKF